MTELEQRISDEIRGHGAISFARFMDLALYCPETGYYQRAEPVIGGTGDYYTSVSVGNLFGELLAFQFRQWTRDEAIHSAQWIEAGAHDGQLAADILQWLRRQHPGELERLEYWIVEPSPRRQALQQARLAEFAGRVRWFDGLHALPAQGVRGIIFSNELLDAFPVRRLGWDASRRLWFEWGVTLPDIPNPATPHEPERRRPVAGERPPQEENGGGPGFVWTRLPADQQRCVGEITNAGLELPPELLALLPDGFALDLCPEAAAWWGQAAQALQAGKLLTIDYGFTADELLRPERTRGTLRAYRQHQVSDDVLAHPGQQDLTAHVHFTQLAKTGDLAGLQTEALIHQSQFLTRIAERAWIESSGFGAWTPALTRQFHTLTRPEHLGRAFRVFTQSRRMPPRDA